MNSCSKNLKRLQRMMQEGNVSSGDAENDSEDE